MMHDLARTLSISEYTAQGYIKTLLVKTESRNRAAMVATIFDWTVARPNAETPVKTPSRLTG